MLLSKWKLIEFYHGRNTGTEKNLRDERRLKNDSKERETERNREKKNQKISVHYKRETEEYNNSLF